jgi:PAS domain S-box-containing protein
MDPVATLRRENDDLRRRLNEAEEALRGEAARAAQRESQKNAELQLREATFRAILDATSDSIWLFSMDGRVLTANPTAVRRFDKAAEEIVGKHFTDILPPDLARARLARLRDVVESGQPVEFEDERAGLHFRHSFYPVFDDNRQVVRVACFSRDITRQKRAEEALRQALAKAEAGDRLLKAVMEHVPEGITIADGPDVTIRMVSRLGQEVLGTSTGVTAEAAAEGKIFHRDGVTPVAYADLPLVRAVQRGETVTDAELVRVLADGSRLPLLCNAAPLRDPAGGITGGIVVWRDISAIRRAEQEVRESEDRLRFALETSHTGAWDLDLSDHTAHRSLEHDRIFGYANLQPQWTYERFLEHVLPGDRAAVDETFQQATAAGSDWSFECRIRRADGAVRWIWGAGRPRRDLAGGQPRIAGIVQDITERKQAEEALRQSREDLSRAQEVGQIGWWRMDTQRNVLTWSDENHRIFGVPMGTPLTYESFMACVHPDDRGYVDARWNAGLAGEPYDIEHRIVADGKVKWVREKAYLEFDDDGGLLGGFGVTQDITARKVAEEELRRAETERKAVDVARAERQRLFDVLEGLPAMICLLTKDHHVAFANRSFRREFGESNGRRCYEYCFGRSEPCEFCQTYDVLETGQPRHWEVTTPKGTVIEVHDFPFTDADGSPMILKMDLDITEHRRAELALEEANRSLAERASQLRALSGELTLTEQRERRRLARVLHDHLQQLLVAAKYQTAALGQAGDEHTRQAAGDLARLLDTSIAAARTLTAELSPPLLQDSGLPAALSWLARWMGDRHGLRVNLATGPDLPPLTEDVKILLFESVRELLFNVVKHAHVHAADVSFSREGATELRIRVSDNGDGFDPASVEIVSDTGGGFGLLSIRERLGLLGGRMEIDSAPGSGSRFTLTAPTARLAASEPAIAPDEARPAPVERVEAAGGAPAPSSPIIRVLIADDHAIVREGLARLLERETGIRVVGEAADGQEAVEMARALQPDVILMDVSMPKMNGLDATRAIRLNHPEIRVIGLSMYEDEERAHAMRKAGAADYLVKSDPPREVLAAIRRAVRSPAQAPPSPTRSGRVRSRSRS